MQKGTKIKMLDEIPVPVLWVSVEILKSFSSLRRVGGRMEFMKNEEMMVVLGVTGQRGRRKGVFVSLFEMEAQPKGVITERRSNLLGVYYMTGNIQTEMCIHTDLTHISLLSERTFPQFMSRVFGEDLGREGNLPVRLGRGETHRKNRGGGNQWKRKVL